MAIVNSDVILISSDDEDDGETNFVTAAVYPDIVLISSDDDDGERNLDEGVASEHEADYIQFDEYESDKEEDNDVKKLIVEECVNNNNQGGNYLHALSLNECKTYLRKHGMRVSGTKEECIQRIEEHNRLKDGNAESLYPKSSFSINCTGDAYRGDIVLFKQNMYNNQRDIIGRRTVAGRIVNESYSASTEHTFSVEVLWSKWFKKLDPLSILLVKGRNLYQFGTFRQPWESESERSEVLKEKHERGKEARRKRKWNEAEFVVGDNKGKKRHKASHKVSSHSKHKHANKNTNAHSQDVLFQSPDLKRSTQLTYHSDPNCSMYSDHHLQEASAPFSYDTTLQLNDLPPGSSTGHSHHNNEQQGPNQALSQPPDHHHHDSESPVHRSIDEKAMIHFPESSFSINCTGEARERDVVLFKQLVYMGGKIAEKKRTVAGRIVKVRQCESRDEHKFLIKVLWIIPSIINRRRFTMLVRSRILYKYGTFRQPWKNEATRSKLFEEKHGSVTRKQRKLKKMDSALNINKGAKRQKLSHNGSSPSKQPTQKAKHKSSKRKGAGASPVKKTKTGSKMKSVRLRKRRAKKPKQQTFQPHTNPNTNLDPSLSANLNQNENLNLIPSTTLNPNPSLHLNQNHNADQNQNLNTRQTENPNSTDPNKNPNSNPISSTTSKPNSSPHLNPNQHTKPNPNPRQKPNLNPRKNLNPKPRQNPNGPEPNQNPNSNLISSTTSNPNPSPHLNRNQHTNPNAHQNQSPNTRQNQNPNSNTIWSTTLKPNPSPHLNPNQHTKPNPRQNPNPTARQNPNPEPRQNPNPNPRQNPNPNPRQNLNANPRQNSHPNVSQNPHPHPSYYMPTHQLQESSLSLTNQPPFWIPPNQSPYGFPGYGGQGDLIISPFSHLVTTIWDVLVLAGLTTLWYQQQ